MTHINKKGLLVAVKCSVIFSVPYIIIIIINRRLFQVSIYLFKRNINNKNFICIF
jgi:hypothetical protein